MSCAVMAWSWVSLIIGIILIVVTSIYLSQKNSNEATFDYKAWESWLWFFLLIGVVLFILGIGGLVAVYNPGSCGTSATSATMGAITPAYTAVPGTLGTTYTPSVGSMVQTSI